MLLRSNKGIALYPEICLQILGEVINSDAKAAGTLLRLSKNFHSLLSLYERSICKSLWDKNKGKYVYTNAEQGDILVSGWPPGDIVVSTLSYPWISEMQCRWNTINFLVGHEITEMLDHTNSWPTLDIPKGGLLRRLVIFKQEALLLLYRLADCAAGSTETTYIRARQSEFLDSLASDELAALGVMVEVIGQGFFTMTKSALYESGLLSNMPVQFSSASHLYTPTTTPFEDLRNDNWIRECMCVFEDLVQRYGPYYAFAYIAGSNESPRRPDIWARALLQEGLDNMNAFEMGYTMSYASLQSVVWRVFCRRVDCTLQDSWNVAKQIVEGQMGTYQI